MLPILDLTVMIFSFQDGVLYFKDSSETALVPGAQTALAIGVESVTITAKPDEGYIFDPESVFVWEIDTRIEVTPAAPTFNDSTGVITIPSETGCIYKIGDTALVAGLQEPITKDVEVIVTATPDEGYKFSAESVTQWTFEWSDIEVTTVAPTFNDTTGVITIPDVEGVIYKIGDTALVAGPQEPITKDVEVIVTATPDEGYKFSAESVTQWTFEWSD